MAIHLLHKAFTTGERENAIDIFHSKEKFVYVFANLLTYLLYFKTTE